MKLFYHIIILFFLCMPAWCIAQSSTVSQFYLNPIIINPALAGSKADGQAAINYRNQWWGISEFYHYASFSIHQPVEKIHGGIGFIVSDENQGGVVNTISTSFIYSYIFSLTHSLKMSIALQTGYNQRSVDVSSLVFYSQINPDGTINSINDDYIYPKYSNLNFSVGGIVYNSNFVAGFYADKLATIDFNKSEKKFPAYSVHFSRKLNNNELKSKKEQYLFSCHVHFQYLMLEKYLNFGLKVENNIFATGIFLKNNLSFTNGISNLIVFGGLNINKMKIGYSYEIPLKSMIINILGTHELTLVYNFNKVEKIKKHSTISCPNF